MSEPNVSSAAMPDDDPRQLAGRVVNGLYRLVKACQIHAQTNQAVIQVVDFVVGAVQGYCRRTGLASVAILFTKSAVFVNRQMLRASRETYQLALELGQLLESCEVTEVTLTKDVSADEVNELGRAVAEVSREGRKSPRFTEGGWENLKLRRVLGLVASDQVTPPARAARTYAAALMLVRRFYVDLREGKYELRQGIKRVAQKLVAQDDAGARLLLTIAAAPPADSDRSGVGLSSAIVAVAMARMITDDRSLLTTLASAALLYDAGRQRLLGYDDGTEPRVQRTLNADEESLLPTSAVVALTALGKLHPPAITRAAIVHEALALHEGLLPYGGRRAPSLLARVLHTARSFVELRVARGASPPLSLDDAIQVLEGQAGDNTSRALVKVLVGALGIFPAGTLVELSTGEMAVVLATPAMPVDFARPPVRVMYDASAQLLSDPFDVDLARPPADGDPERYVVRPIDSTDQQMKQMRAYVAQLAADRAKRRSLDKAKAASAPRAPQPSLSDDLPPPSVPSGALSFGSAVSAASSSSGPSGSGFSSGGISDISGGAIAAAPSSAISAVPSGEPRSAVARPPTRRWDPGNERQATPNVPINAAGIVVPAPAKPDVAASGGPGNTRAVRWDQYQQEVAEAAQVAPPSAGAPLSETDALLAAYLAGEESGTSRNSSAGESKSLGGLRWGGGERSSSPGRSAGEPTSSGGFGSASRGLTGQPASSGGFGSASRGLTGQPVSSGGFGSASRGLTGQPASSGGFGDVHRSVTPVSTPGVLPERVSSGGIGLKLPSSPGHGHDRPSAGGPPLDRGTKHGVGGTEPPPKERAAPALGPASPPASSVAKPPVSAPQPLRGSLQRAGGAGGWAAGPKVVPQAPPVVSESTEPQPSSSAQPDATPSSQTLEGPTSKRAKAGSSAWGAPRTKK